MGSDFTLILVITEIFDCLGLSWKCAFGWGVYIIRVDVNICFDTGKFLWGDEWANGKNISAVAFCAKQPDEFANGENLCLIFLAAGDAISGDEVANGENFCSDLVDFFNDSFVQLSGDDVAIGSNFSPERVASDVDFGGVRIFDDPNHDSNFPVNDLDVAANAIFLVLLLFIVAFDLYLYLVIECGVNESGPNRSEINSSVSSFPP